MIIIHSSPKQQHQGVQGLQAFAFCVVNTNYEHMKHKLKNALGLNVFESSGLKVFGNFLILLSQDRFETDCLETKFQTITS